MCLLIPDSACAHSREDTLWWCEFVLVRACVRVAGISIRAGSSYCRCTADLSAYLNLCREMEHEIELLLI